jgi:high-affinity iron transporter
MVPVQSTHFWKRCAAVVVLVWAGLGTAWAADPNAEARQAWQLLDYIAVDYAGAVRDGQVVEPGEYAEMQEFGATVRAKLAALPAQPEQPALLAATDRLNTAIATRAAPEQVAKEAHALADILLKAYRIETTPTAAPDVAKAAPLYAQQCAACHGATGQGDGPAAASLTPRPIAFTDAERAAQRSPLALYQVISQGLDGTAMTGFTHLSDSDRWALAFYVGSLAYDDKTQAHGETLWRDEPKLRDAIPTLEALSRSSEVELAQAIQADSARAITAYLRTHPDAVVAPAHAATGSFAIARQKLADSLEAYRTGDTAQAKALALSSYLDGVEPLEAALASRDRNLMRQIEAAMGELRSRITAQKPASEVSAQATAVTALFDRAEGVLRSAENDATTAFLGSFTILLREGLEALLIVIGMIAFLRKAERRDVLPYVHAGWLSALAAGGLTWGVAALFGVAVLVEVARRAWFGAEPLAPIMAIAAGVALIGNLICFVLLTRFRSEDMNMRSVWLCSRNDLVNNVGVIAAAGLVAWTHSPWPDLVIGALVAVLFLRTAAIVLSGAWQDWHRRDEPVFDDGRESACASRR